MPTKKQQNKIAAKGWSKQPTLAPYLTGLAIGIGIGGWLGIDAKGDFPVAALAVGLFVLILAMIADYNAKRVS
jgi:hypothetical protein